MVTAWSSNTFLSPYFSVSQTPHPYIPTCGRSLQFSCRAAEGVTEECTLRVLLLTIMDHPSKLQPKIPLLTSRDNGRMNCVDPVIYYYHKKGYMLSNNCKNLYFHPFCWFLLVSDLSTLEFHRCPTSYCCTTTKCNSYNQCGKNRHGRLCSRYRIIICTTGILLQNILSPL